MNNPNDATYWVGVCRKRGGFLGSHSVAAPRLYRSRAVARNALGTYRETDEAFDARVELREVTLVKVVER